MEKVIKFISRLSDEEISEMIDNVFTDEDWKHYGIQRTTKRDIKRTGEGVEIFIPFNSEENDEKRPEQILGIGLRINNDFSFGNGEYGIGYGANQIQTRNRFVKFMLYKFGNEYGDAYIEYKNREYNESINDSLKSMLKVRLGLMTDKTQTNSSEFMKLLNETCKTMSKNLSFSLTDIKSELKTYIEQMKNELDNEIDTTLQIK